MPFLKVIYVYFSTKIWFLIRCNSDNFTDSPTFLESIGVGYTLIQMGGKLLIPIKIDTMIKNSSWKDFLLKH